MLNSTLSTSVQVQSCNATHHTININASSVVQCQTPHYQYLCKLSHAMPHTPHYQPQCKLSHAMPHTTLSTLMQAQSCDATHHTINISASSVMRCHTPHYQHQCKLSHAMPHTTLSTSVQAQSCNATHHTINISAGSVSAAVSKSKTHN